MKILFCDNSLKDLLNFRGDVINDYIKDEHNIIIVAPKNIELPNYLTNIKLIPIKLNRSGMNPLKEILYFIRLYNIYREEKPDYIFHYTIKPNIYGTLAAHLCGIQSTAMIAGLGYVFDHKGLGSFIARWLYRFALKFSQYVLVLNSYNREIVINKHIATPNKVILLPGGEGINLDKFKKEVRNEKTFNDSAHSI